MMGVPESPLNSRRDPKVFDLIAMFPFTYRFKLILGCYITKALVKASWILCTSLYFVLLNTLDGNISNIHFFPQVIFGWKHN